MTEPSDRMSERELADWQYAHRDELDAEQGDEVDAHISSSLSVTLSFRLPAAEADSIRTAAADSGLTLSEWIRRACASSADESETSPVGGAYLEHLAQVMHDMDKASAHLRDVLRRHQQRVERASRQAERARRAARSR